MRNRLRLVSVLTAVAVLVPMSTALAAEPAPGPAAPTSVSTSAGGDPELRAEIVAGAAPRTAARAAAAAATPSEEVLTFSEFPLGTQVREQYVQRGIRFAGDTPFIAEDGAQPTTPVLSGTPLYEGAVEGWFVNPDGDVRTVDSLTLDVGYINSPHSTLVTVYGRDGAVLLTVDLAAGGIVHTVIHQVGMARFRVESISDEPAGFSVDNVTFPSPAPAGPVADEYVALGDSFQSGEGAGNYEEGTNQKTGGNGCRRSFDAYPHRLVADGVVNLDLDFRACSGATMETLINGMNGETGQLGALGEDTRLVTLGIVGNDLEFGDVLTTCVAAGGGSFLKPWTFWKSCEGNLGDRVDANIASLESSAEGEIGRALRDLYATVREKAPYARVVVVNYPRFFQDGGAMHNWIWACQGIATSDQVWINSQIDEADTLINRWAQRAGFEYVDMRDVLLGHEQCTDEPAINGVRATDLTASFHPNALGHEFMAERIADHLGRTVEPSFRIHPGETVTGTYTIRGSAFTLNTGWPGSDVVTTLVSPSGVRYSREDPNGAEHGVGPTWEHFTITDPEPGEWTALHFGADVDPAGEPVTVTTLDEVPLNQAPVGRITTTTVGTTVRLDASASTDDDGEIVRAEWDLGDGTFLEGTVVEHTFTPGEHQVALVLTDDDGARSVVASPVLGVGTDPASATLYSGDDLALTNTVTLAGPGASVLVDGDLTCTSDAVVGGSVVVTGDAYLTNRCRIDGDLWVAGDVRATSTPRVGGDLRVGGDVTLQSTARVGGGVFTAGTVRVSDGRTVEQLQADGRIGGEVHTGLTDLPLPAAAAPRAVDTAVPEGAVSVTWAHWLRSTAVAAKAPAWSSGLQRVPGCALASWSVGTSTVTVPSDTHVDATGTGCSAVSLNGLTLRLAGDLTLVAPSISSTTGLRVESVDGLPHRLRLVTPGTVSAGAPSKQTVTLVGTTTVDPAVLVEVATPGTFRVDGPADLRAQVVAGRVAATGAVTFRR